MSKTYLDLSAVGMRFKTDKDFFEALVDVNLKIAKGEFISLIGHSGCGKSTVLNLVAGQGDKLTLGDHQVHINQRFKEVFVGFETHAHGT
jgi:ABC-type nitrate/sulfonate/bicarbonate transport system ATPase subunit